MTCDGTLPRPLGEGWGERLSKESSCIGVMDTRIACFCVEADEQFAGQRDTDHHFFFAAGQAKVHQNLERLKTRGLQYALARRGRSRLAPRRPSQSLRLRRRL